MKFNNRNVFISPKAQIGLNVKIGDNVSIYDNVIVGDNSIICNDCVLGEPMQSYYYTDDYNNLPTIIGPDSLIRSHSIIYCGCELGEGLSTGHRIVIREYTKVGRKCRIGTMCELQGHATIGDYSWLHSNVHIGQHSLIGNFVFVYSFTIFTNDPIPPSEICIGPTVGDYSIISVHTVLLPKIKIGKHSFVGAGSVVSKDVDDFQMVSGNPAKFIRDMRELKKFYPWPYRFDRGMPWKDAGYEKWMNENQ